MKMEVKNCCKAIMTILCTRLGVNLFSESERHWCMSTQASNLCLGYLKTWGMDFGILLKIRGLCHCSNLTTVANFSNGYRTKRLKKCLYLITVQTKITSNIARIYESTIEEEAAVVG